MKSIVLNQNPDKAQATASTESVYQKPYYEVDTQEQGYEVRVFMPGVTKKGLSILLEEGILTLEGQRAANNVPDSWRVVYRELPEYNYRLRLELNVDIDSDKINAQFQDGVILLSLPLAESTKARTIKID